MTFVFSDLIPNAVGPLRSARLFHAWLREEWDCGFIFYGQQEYTESNVPEAFKSTGEDKKCYVYDAEGKEVFQFGKHKGERVEDVFRKEPAYFSWMMNPTSLAPYGRRPQ